MMFTYSDVSVELFDPFSPVPIHHEVPQSQEPVASEKTGKCGHLCKFAYFK